MSRDFNGFSKIGAKSQLVDRLTKILNWCASEYECDYFLDATMGGGRIVLGVDQTKFKVIIGNDLETGFVNLMSSMQDEGTVKALIVKIDKLIEQNKDNPKRLFEEIVRVRREETKAKNEGVEFNIDRLVSAAYCFMGIYSHHKASNDTFNIYAFDKNFLKNKRHKKLIEFNDEVRRIIFLNDNFFDLLKRYGADEKLLIYIDPPYVEEAMASKNHYEFNMSNEDHERLVSILSDDNFKAKFILSNWENEIYKSIEGNGNVRKYYVGSIKPSSGTSKGKNLESKNEYIWTNMYIDESFLPDESEAYTQEKKEFDKEALIEILEQLVKK